MEVEICVLGGGPAGSVTAQRLARLGHDVLLVDRGGNAKPHRTESLASAVPPILDSLCLQESLHRASFCCESHALLRWESDTVQIDRRHRGPSHLIDREQFDKCLREAASSASVRLVTPARAHAPRRHAAGGWDIRLSAPDDLRSIRARFLVDARGRRHGNETDGTQPPPPPTVAVAGLWAGDGDNLSETRIEAGRDEWFWGCPLPGGAYAATVFLDSMRLGGLAKEARLRLYNGLLLRSELLRGLMQRELVGSLRICDATCRVASDPVGADFIRVGEAAFTVDPLSSQGVQAAILSAIHGSAVVHTILARPANQQMAVEFYRGRQKASAAESRRNTARHYWRRAQGLDSAFWLRRSLGVGERSAPEHDRIWRSIPTASPLVVSDAVRIVEVPMLAGDFIERAAAISHPAFDHPTGYLGSVPLVPLIRRIDRGATRDQILRAWGCYVAPMAACKIMDWMYQVGLLVTAPDGQ